MKFYRNWRGLLAFLLLIFIAVSTWGQQPAEPPGPQSSAAPQPAQDSAENKPSASAAQPAETRISPQEAEELFRSVDDILKFASQDTALPVHKSVKRRLTSRDEVTAYLEKHMAEDEDAQRLQRSELVLKKFGLLPRDFDLQKFLVALLREQVAGYYDPKTGTVNLLDWLDVEQQRPVLAHELTHALQDQSFGLEKWSKAGVSDLALKKKDPTPEDIQNDELQTARQAVVEGQAMAVLIDYILAPTGQSMLTSPQLVEALKAGMLVGTADSVEFHKAPIFLREMLTFPYRYGLDFVATVMQKEGKERAFAGVFKTPPRTTRQVMEPQTYLSGEVIEAMSLPEFSRILKDYDKFDVGSMGEFDVALLVDEYAGIQTSQKVFPHWRGGYYYAAKSKHDSSAPLAILYVSRWSSPESASGFARIYAQSLKKRYHSIRLVSKAPKQESASDGAATAPAQDFSGERDWLTEDGDVVIDTQGNTVFIAESFDQTTAQKLHAAVMTRAKATAAAK